MLKLTFCLVRLPRLTRDEFQTYWRGTHAPLVASVAETLQIRRYVQLHSLPHEASVGIRESRSAPEEFDGVAELWFDSLETVIENGRRPGAQAAGAMLLEDEKRFIDLPRSPLWWGQEHVVVG